MCYRSGRSCEFELAEGVLVVGRAGVFDRGGEG